MNESSAGGNMTHVYDKAAIARSVARMLLEIDAVLFRADEPFKLTSGMASPVYIDCRKIISFPRMRSAMYSASPRFLTARKAVVPVGA